MKLASFTTVISLNLRDRRTNDGLVCRGMAAVCLKSGRDEHAVQWRERAEEIDKSTPPPSPPRVIRLRDREDMNPHNVNRVLSDGIPRSIDDAN